ncbi:MULTISPECIES: SHOCT domain-containing protein [unclassified Chryseobacterium]|uniref:SHOCT domain-containing protein n=1 Tax=unclassified Chryseobacterium TaxID=2593645 RepID=UPI0019D38818|nr:MULTISPECIES: SHOCT domain-containing protein [unclassified Chryseobacterium]
MNRIITFILVFLSIGMVQAQLDVKRNKIISFKASNTIEYKVGDTITLGQGTAPDGKFNYLQMGGFGNTMSLVSNAMGNFNDGYGMGADRNMSGQTVIIKKIKVEKNKRGGEKVFFVVGMGNFTNGNLFIEDAIQTCEIKDCIQKIQDVNVVSQESKYDTLKKLQQLKDAGTLTPEEFEIEKAKILK